MSMQQHIVSAGDIPPPLPSICVDHLHAQCSLRERKTSCGNTKCPRAHITLPQQDTPLRDIPELRTHLQYMPTLLVAVDRRSKHSNPLVIRMPTHNALFTVGITKAVDCAFHGGQRVPYVCYDFLERTCAYGSQCYGIHVVDFDLQSVPRERFRAAVGERDMTGERRHNSPSHQHVTAPIPGVHGHGGHSRTSSGCHHSRSSSQGSDRGPLGGYNMLTPYPTPAREVAIPVPDAYAMSYQETIGTPPRAWAADGSEDGHPHPDTVRMMHDGVQMVHAAHEANVALMSDVETFFAAAERVLRVAKQTCAQQCQAVVAKRLHDVSEHLQTLLTLQRSPQPPGTSLRITHDVLMRNTPHAMRTVSPHETTVSFVGDVVVPRITYARHDGIVETVNPPVAHPPAGWSPLPGYAHHHPSAAQHHPSSHHPSSHSHPNSQSIHAVSHLPHSLSGTLTSTPPTPQAHTQGGRGSSDSLREQQQMPPPPQAPGQSLPHSHSVPAVSEEGSAARSDATEQPALPGSSEYDEEEWAVVQLLKAVQSALTH